MPTDTLKRQRQYAIAVRLYYRAQERYRRFSNKYRPEWITRRYRRVGALLDLIQRRGPDAD